MMEAGELVQKVDERIRGQAHTSDFILRLISKVQQIVNAGTGLVRETTTLQTRRYMQMYDVRDDLPNQVSMRAVRDNGTYDTEHMLSWKELMFRNRRWFRRISSRFESFAMLGTDLLLIHPGKAQDDVATVVYTKLTVPLAVLSDAIELPVERTALVVDIVEALLLLRERRMESLVPLMKRALAEIPMDMMVA